MLQTMRVFLGKCFVAYHPTFTVGSTEVREVCVKIQQACQIVCRSRMPSREPAKFFRALFVDEFGESAKGFRREIQIKDEEILLGQVWTPFERIRRGLQDALLPSMSGSNKVSLSLPGRELVLLTLTALLAAAARTGSSFA